MVDGEGREWRAFGLAFGVGRTGVLAYWNTGILGMMGWD